MYVFVEIGMGNGKCKWCMLHFMGHGNFFFDGFGILNQRKKKLIHWLYEMDETQTRGKLKSLNNEMINAENLNKNNK